MPGSLRCFLNRKSIEVLKLWFISRVIIVIVVEDGKNWRFDDGIDGRSRIVVRVSIERLELLDNIRCWWKIGVSGDVVVIFNQSFIYNIGWRARHWLVKFLMTEKGVIHLSFCRGPHS